MKRLSAFFGMPAVVLALTCCHNSKKEPVDYVNPYIGNISHLLVPTYPTVQLPHSLLRVFPLRYEYTREHVSGLPLLVTGHRSEAPLSIGFPEYKLNFDNEHITPYRYEARLADSQIGVDFAVSHQSALYEFTFTEKKPVTLTVNADEGAIEAEGNTVHGYQKLSDTTSAYVYLEFEQTPKEISHPDGRINSISLVFEEPVVRVRYGASFISEEQAAKNLSREIQNYNVNSLAAKGRSIWNKALSRLEVEGGSEDDLTVFYTSYYRTLERPICISEDGKYWSGEDNAVHEDEGIPFYTDDWLWDTYHSAHPLRTILDVPMEEQVLTSYLRMAEQTGKDWLPCFPAVEGAGRLMNAYHVIASLADAYVKGLNVDLQKAANAASHTLHGRTLLPWCPNAAGQLDAFYWEHGYMPALKAGEVEFDPNVDHFEKRQPIPVTLGNSYDCWCTALLTKAAGMDEEAAFFEKHSFDYRNVFNPATCFFHPKDSAGNFIEPFNYNMPGGMGARDYYDENNAWVYRWEVQHNFNDLISLMGGNERFIDALDNMFATPLDRSKFDFYAIMPDHTGNVGQFSMGNEPSLHVPYLYNLAGAPWKTQKRIRQMLKTWFRNDLMGVPGDEDGGGLTSFVVFSSLGFFPLTPGRAEYSIGSPLFERAKIHVGNGKTFEVKANNVSDDNKYIQSATLNGKPLNTTTISHQDIVAGGTLVLEMGALPNKTWGTEL